ncbi:MAG: energy-coupling factor transporter transmembrane protein EcfT [Bacteroidota bacterium]|nr:energy-coupling factor transporter transmembrane protein EcfT [Bacteroidota bacterium]
MNKINFHPSVLIALLIFTFSVALFAGIFFQSVFVAFFLFVSLFIKKRKAFWKKMARFGVPLTAVLLIVNDLVFSAMGNAQGIHYALRFLVLLLPLLTIVHTTTPAEFAMGLRSLRLPPRFNHIFLLSFEAFDSFRTITRNVSTAQQLRGFRARRNIFSRAKNLFPLLLPVAYSALSMSLERGIAFEFKGVDSPFPKTYVAEWKPTAFDIFTTATLIVASFLLLVL